MYDAKSLLNKISDGISNAHESSTSFLGIYNSIHNNPKIHPEYLLTVKVAELLPDGELIIKMEPMAKAFTIRAKNIYRNKNKTRRNKNYLEPKIEDLGQKRLDISVIDPSDDKPIALIEAKLGDKSPSTIIADLDKLMYIFDAYNSNGLEDQIKNTYFCCIFHTMSEGVDAKKAIKTHRRRTKKIEDKIKEYKNTRNNLNYKIGIIESHQIEREIETIVYDYDLGDGTTQQEEILSRDNYFFAPSVLIFGAPDDINQLEIK